GLGFRVGSVTGLGALRRRRPWLGVRSGASGRGDQGRRGGRPPARPDRCLPYRAGERRERGQRLPEAGSAILMSIGRLGAWTVGLLLCIVATSAAQEAPLTVRVGPAGAGCAAVGQTAPLPEHDALRAALDSALPLRFHLRVELWRRGLVDRLAATDEVAIAMLQDPLTGGYTIEAPGMQRRLPTLEAARQVLER